MLQFFRIFTVCAQQQVKYIVAGPVNVVLPFLAEIPTEVFLNSHIMVPGRTGNTRLI
jgi:hypothetical protein